MLDVILAQSGPGIDWSRLIGVALVFLFLGGGWLAKIFKALAERRGGSGASAGGGRASKLERMAARRRDQLERMAQRQDQRGQPTNMTMAERIEREKAQQAYKQRAEALRRQQQQQAQAGRGGRQPAQRQPQPTARQTQRRSGQSGTQRRAATQPQPQRQRARQAELVELHEIDEKQIEVVDLPVKGTVKRRARIQLGKLNRQSLRHAIIMKELLDRPVALRASHPSAEEL